MKHTLLSSLLATAAIATPVAAQQKAGEHGAHHAAPAATSAENMTDGEIRKVDTDSKKITIKHAEIKSLDMPPMTMVFQIKEAGLLDKLKVGDKIRFAAEKTASGGFMVTAIQPVKP